MPLQNSLPRQAMSAAGAGGVLLKVVLERATNWKSNQIVIENIAECDRGPSAQKMARRRDGYQADFWWRAESASRYYRRPLRSGPNAQWRFALFRLPICGPGAAMLSACAISSHFPRTGSG
jgi:hypothetical protein